MDGIRIIELEFRRRERMGSPIATGVTCDKATIALTLARAAPTVFVSVLALSVELVKRDTIKLLLSSCLSQARIRKPTSSCTTTVLKFERLWNANTFSKFSRVVKILTKLADQLNKIKLHY